MKKTILLLIGSFLLAISMNAQILSSKITSEISPACSQDSNGSAAITAYGGFPPYTYLWEPSGQTTDTATGLFASTQYTVMVTDSGGVDTAISYLTLGTVSTLSASTSSADVSCFGLFNGRAMVNITGGVSPYQILWTPGGNTTILDTALGAGTYTSTIIDSVGCAVSAGTTIAQPAQLALTATAIDSIGVAIASGGTAPYTYSWSPGGFTSDTVRGLHRGTYTITVNDANLCSNVAIVTITNSTLGIAFPTNSGTVSCGNPSYFYFPLIIAADTAVMFNSCVVDINIGSEFAGDSATNGGIIVTRGMFFQPGTGNDYNIFNVTNLSDTVIQIQLGDVSDSSPNGTIIPDYSVWPPDTLFAIKLRVQNSCHNSFVNFTNTDTTAFISYYAGYDSVPYTKHDTAITIVCVACVTDSCDYDSTCDCYLSLCTYDSVAYRFFDTILYAHLYKNIPYTTDYAGKTRPDVECGPFIDTYTDPIMAG
ncbi:MAG TPA: SprB repeat-containing protein, partial [Bacteroidia bacterium]|nr:SprB repeat-containing protein [Bacteroidia bacterium]